MELKFGCEIIQGENHFVVIGTMPNGEPITVKKEGAYDSKKAAGAHLDKFLGKSVILGRPIRLADVLLTVQKKGLPDQYLFFNANWRGNLEVSGAFGNKFAKWNYADDNLDHQSEECKQFLAELLS